MLFARVRKAISDALRFLTFLFLGLLIAPSYSNADLCNAFNEVGSNPDLYDQAIWEDLARLDPNASPEAVENLLTRHRKFPDEAPTTSVGGSSMPPPAPIGTTEVILGNNAQSAYKKLKSATQNIQNRVDEFIEAASRNGMDSIRELGAQRGWNLKPLHSNHAGRFSARMNGGYRVLFEQLESGAIHIVDMGKHVTH